MAEIFLSYAREDREKAKQLADALGAMGWEVWWDRTLVPGTNFREEIDRQLSAARCVVVLWSDNSLKAQFVLDEADEARERRVLVQALIAKVTPPKGFRQEHWADLTEWSGDASAPQLVDLCAGITRHPSPSRTARNRGTSSQNPRPTIRLFTSGWLSSSLALWA